MVEIAWRNCVQLNKSRYVGLIKYLTTFYCTSQIMLNYGTINNMNSLYYSSIQVLVGFINSVIAIRAFFISNTRIYFNLNFLCSDEFSVWKLYSSCLLNPPSASGYLMISTIRSIDFHMVLFSAWPWFHSVCLLFINWESCFLSYGLQP